MMSPIAFRCGHYGCAATGLFHYDGDVHRRELVARHGEGRWRCDLHKRNCSTCLAWSQLLAEVRCGVLRAACLNPASPFHGGNPDRWPGERTSCSSWTDDPKFADLPIGGADD